MFEQQDVLRPQYAIDEAQSGLLRSVFMWMALGLFSTAIMAAYVVNTPALYAPLMGSGIIWLLIIAELGLVFWLSARVMTMQPSTATTVFLIYSLLNGVTLAPLALVYTGESIATAFIVTAGTFTAMASYGYATKKDLSGWGSFLFMGLIGIIIAAIVNIFIGSSMISFAISALGVLIFTGLTAFHVQKIKHMGAALAAEDANFRRVAILGALTLYLDFINLFIHLLHFLGNSRD